MKMRHSTLLFALLLTFSCDSTFDASRLDNNVANTSWLFEKAETDEGEVLSDAGAIQKAQINFGDKSLNPAGYEVSGYNGCNAFSGLYNVDGTDINFTQIVQTERACMATEARIEEVFNRGILNARSFSLDGDVLVIDAPGPSVKLRLTRIVAPPFD